MKKAKMVLAALAAAIMGTSALGLAACGGKTPVDPDPGNNTVGGGNDTPPATTSSITVTFDANERGSFADGKTQVEVTAKADGTVTLPTAPEPDTEDYEFAGWNMQADGEGSTVLSTTKFESDATVYAQWSLIDDDQGGPGNGGSGDNGSGGSGDNNGSGGGQQGSGGDNGGGSGSGGHDNVMYPNHTAADFQVVGSWNNYVTTDNYVFSDASEDTGVAVQHKLVLTVTKATTFYVVYKKGENEGAKTWINDGLKASYGSPTAYATSERSGNIKKCTLSSAGTYTIYLKLYDNKDQSGGDAEPDGDIDGSEIWVSQGDDTAGAVTAYAPVDNGQGGGITPAPITYPDHTAADFQIVGSWNSYATTDNYVFSDASEDSGVAVQHKLVLTVTGETTISLIYKKGADNGAKTWINAGFKASYGATPYATSEGENTERKCTLKSAGTYTIYLKLYDNKDQSGGDADPDGDIDGVEIWVSQGDDTAGAVTAYAPTNQGGGITPTPPTPTANYIENAIITGSFGSTSWDYKSGNDIVNNTIQVSLNSGDRFKIATKSSGTVNWSGALLDYGALNDAASKALARPDKDGNVVVWENGTYVITLVSDTKFTLTRQEGAITVTDPNSALNYGAVDTTNSGNDCWIVGQFAAINESFGWDSGYKLTWNTTAKRWQITITLYSGDSVKFRRPFNDNANYGYNDVTLAGKLSVVGDNIQVLEDGVYTFSLQASDDNRALHIVGSDTVTYAALS